MNDPLPHSKPHYHLIDGLRGVAAIMVVIYHLGEGFCTSPADLWLANHGYLAVQFFFILSGFVLGYSYDDRWTGMTSRVFLRRRIIRLQPMVAAGVVLGVAAYFMQGSVTWSGEHISPIWVVLAGISTFFMIPAWAGSPLEIRGNAEMFPVNGPLWSLFFEYLGSLAYCLAIRRLSTRALACFTAVAAVGVGAFSIGNATGYYHFGVGWSLSGAIPWGGAICMLFCFSAGFLMARIFNRLPRLEVRGAFWWCAAVIVILLSMPYVDYGGCPWLNGIYETICVVFVFPLLVWIAASGKTTDGVTTFACNFSGDISYPLYAVHYPSLYLFYAWVWANNLTWGEAWPVAAALVAGNILLAWLLLKYYDAPVRKWLSRKGKSGR